jgi:hypothetical protein
MGVWVNVCNPTTQEAEANNDDLDVSLDYMARPYLKKKQTKQTNGKTSI